MTQPQVIFEIKMHNAFEVGALVELLSEHIAGFVIMGCGVGLASPLQKSGYAPV